jgi:peptidyl-prolyl cis-trans isomerase D
MIRFLQTPGPLKKVILSGLLLFICVAMLLFLIPTGNAPLTGSNSEILARVGDRDITATDAQRLLQLNLQGRPMLPEYIPMAVQALVSQQAEVMEAHRLGLQVSDREIDDWMRNGPRGQDFFPKGVYIGDDRATELINNQFNMPVSQFRDFLRDQLLLEKLRSMVEAPVTVSPQEIEQEFLHDHVKVKFAYAVLNVDDIARQLSPTEAELKSYYDSHKAQYASSIPEKRKARYLVVDIARFQAPLPRPELERYYNQHREEFRQPEEVKASHILIKTPQPGPDGKVDAKADAEAKTKAEGILKQLKAGANFEALAKKYSDDKGSAINGGSLGWFQRGAMVPEFSAAAFSSPKGQLSGIVKTIFGYHIIRVDDKHQAGVRSLDEVKSTIEPMLEEQKAQHDAESLANTLESEARAHGLDAAGAKHGLPVVTADWFSRGDSLAGIGPSPELMNEIFSVREKSPPEAAPTGHGYAVFELTGVKPPGTPAFADIRDRVTTDFKNDRARQLLLQKAQELSDRAHATHDLKRAAKEEGATLKTSELVTLQSQVPDLGSLSGPASVALTLPVGGISGPLPAGRNAAVLSLLQRQEPSAGELEKSRAQISESLLQRRRQEATEIYQASVQQRLEKEGKIKINQDQLNTYVRRASLGG